MNEEEVKLKVVVPYLSRLGLMPDELVFEKSFVLDLGTNRVQVKGKRRTRGEVGARLDTLVTRRGRNLLVWELKEAAHAFTDQDRAQAVSYARLVHPIAPFALLTNGSVCELLDTVTRAVIDPQSFKLKDAYEVVLPEADRSAAIEIFLGYSEDNLLAFCRTQVAEHMRPLIGTPDDLTKKFIPELTVRRKDLADELAAFESSPCGGFLLLGDSGGGKTTALCDYVRQRLEERKPTLFFAGGTLGPDLLPAIVHEFSWTFVEQLTPASLFKRISGITDGVPLIVVVDAVDEWTSAQKGPSLLKVLRAVRGLNVKVVFSCKTNAWAGIAEPDGSDLGFADLLMPRRGHAGPFSLGAFSPEEFTRAVLRYRRTFHGLIRIEDQVLEEARRNPFLLRVVFAVAAESGEDRISFSSRAFFERYLEVLLRKSGQKDVARVQLVRTARAMFEHNREVITEDEARVAVGLSASETLLPALFERNILHERVGGMAFYFPQLRSYLIAFQVFDWPQAKPADLTLFPTGVQWDAMAFYLRYATGPQLQALTDPLWDNAHAYLNYYLHVVKTHFPALDRELTPGDEEAVGFIAEYALSHRSLTAYGFKRRTQTEPPVLFVPVTQPFGKSNLTAVSGADELHHTSSSNGFWMLNIREEVLRHEIETKLDKIVAERRLNLDGCELLMTELVVRAVRDSRNFFHPCFDPNGGLRFPVSTKTVRDLILRGKLRVHFETVIHERKRAQGREREWKFSQAERSEIETEIDQVMQQGPWPNLFARSNNLEAFEEYLARTGVFTDLPEIAQSPWPTEYELAEACVRDPAQGTAQLHAHLKRFYEAFLLSYQRIVDRNFPTLRDAFKLRQRLPVRVYLSPHIDVSRRDGRLGGAYTLVEEPLPVSAANEVIVCAPGELQTDGKTTYLDQVIPDGRPRFCNRLSDLLDLQTGTPLADRVYQEIGRDWPAAKKRLRELEPAGQH